MINFFSISFVLASRLIDTFILSIKLLPNNDSIKTSHKYNFCVTFHENVFKKLSSLP